MDYKLGKLDKRDDIRNIKWMSIRRKTLAPPPSSFDVDISLGGLSDNHMFANDILGDCVIAGRGHMTLRFEVREQKQVIPIADSDIASEYFKETGGPDSGLVMLNSLNLWRKGWTAAGKNYSIYAFAELDITQPVQMQEAIYLLGGCYAGIQVSQSALDQFSAGQPWDVVANDGGIKGGHCIYIVSYTITASGPIYDVITWGKRQKMKQAFWLKYGDEAYGIVDNIDSWMDPATDPVVVSVLNATLQEIISQPTPPEPTPTPTPVRCPWLGKFAKGHRKK